MNLKKRNLSYWWAKYATTKTKAEPPPTTVLESAQNYRGYPKTNNNEPAVTSYRFQTIEKLHGASNKQPSTNSDTPSTWVAAPAVVERRPAAISSSTLASASSSAASSASSATFSGNRHQQKKARSNSVVSSIVSIAENEEEKCRSYKVGKTKFYVQVFARKRLDVDTTGCTAEVRKKGGSLPTSFSLALAEASYAFPNNNATPTNNNSVSNDNVAASDKSNNFPNDSIETDQQIARRVLLHIASRTRRGAGGDSAAGCAATGDELNSPTDSDEFFRFREKRKGKNSNKVRGDAAVAVKYARTTRSRSLIGC